MCALMKWPGCAARRGSSSLTDGEMPSGVVLIGGGDVFSRVLRLDILEVGLMAEAASSGEIWGGISDIAGVSGDPTCWRVELKYPARFGRRKTGGRRVSSTDFLIVLVSMVSCEILHSTINVRPPESELC
jgi:hypothetical protein